MSINDSKEKINPVRNRGSLRVLAVSNGVKQFLDSSKGKDILVVIIIVLTGMASFELGRLSKSDPEEGIRIEYPNQPTNLSANVISADNTSNNDFLNTAQAASADKKFFASSKGSKYYPVGCSAGKTIKQANRVYFSTREAAEKAGYELSSSCR